jgi:hypothetical protein
MSYIGSTPTTQSFISGTDYFNGTGSQTAFTLSRSVASVNDIQATVNNVVQVPNDAYTISGTTITFTSAPSAGTSNVYVRYLSTTTQAITPSQGTVSWSTLNADTQQDLGISFKNRIINGAMTIAQRGTSGAANSAGSMFLDRWLLYSSSGTSTVSQSSDAPAGFSNSLLWTQSSAGTRNSGDYFEFVQKIEGYNIADLNQGTANAKTFTISFWVKSSVTGTYSVAIRNGSATYQNYVTTYTVNSANTWEQKTITITGSTTGGWLTTNGIGLEIWFDLGTGTSNQTSTLNSWISGNAPALVANTQVGFAQTSGATFYITGVMLELGTQATTFDNRSYGTELQLCQRYFYLAGTGNTVNLGNGYYHGASQVRTVVIFPTLMRSAPSLVSTSGSNYYQMEKSGGSDLFNSLTIYQSQPYSAVIYNGSEASGTDGFAGNIVTNNASTYVGFSAEL